MATADNAGAVSLEVVEKLADEGDVKGAVEIIENAQQVSKETFEAGIQRMLVLVIEGYPRALRSTAAKRNEILRKNNGNQDGAVEDVKEQAAALAEEGKTWMLGLLPFIGFPAKLAYPTWRCLRRVCLMAGIYGHDLQTTETRAKILHVFAGLRAVPVGEWVLEEATQAVWVAFAGPIAGALPVGTLCSKVANVEGHVLAAVGNETFQEGRQPVPPAVYMQELDPEPTAQDYLDLAKAGSAYAAYSTCSAARHAVEVARDKKRRNEAMGSAQRAAGDLAQQAKVIGQVGIEAAPGAASSAATKAKEGLSAGLAMGKNLLGGNKK
eukprot:gnl/TRDRNA2_/TRDRNA2_83181_c0_seq1.p1 gnl/TRDRNA2_/TRDRNA2_83181_c0~~gnl/TRDRNA2_/TRDRNA2_83181_c0_seq1.p1  ORF type:complete len:324 (+),score=72.23 gnl/TRDRNA2_/TRDRNA2_83181_c0_seq1:42-1013(+)